MRRRTSENSLVFSEICRTVFCRDKDCVRPSRIVRIFSLNLRFFQFQVSYQRLQYFAYRAKQFGTSAVFPNVPPPVDLYHNRADPRIFLIVCQRNERAGKRGVYRSRMSFSRRNRTASSASASGVRQGSVPMQKSGRVPLRSISYGSGLG